MKLEYPIKKENYIPALKYHLFTPIYDFFIGITMPEKKFKMALIQQMNIQKGETILDFGAGTITLTMLAAKEYPDTNFIALDIDPEMIKIAKKKIVQTTLQNIKIDNYLGRNLPYEDIFFDKIMSSLVFHHLTTEQKILAFTELKRVLKPNGELHIADWGKAQNYLMRFLFFILQIFDNFHTTSANVRGNLPAIIKKAGFTEVVITKSYATIFGTLQFFCCR